VILYISAGVAGMSKEKKKHESDKKDEKTSGMTQEKAPETNTAVENSAEAAQPEAIPEESSFEKALKEADDLKKQIIDSNDRYIRLMAEFDNYKKRTSREYERQVDSANEKIMLEMIDVRENFERAIKSGDAGSDYVALFEGMKLIFNKFDTVLNKNGLEPFAVSGDPFDPQIHDALMNAPKAGVPADHVADVYEKGYKLKSKVIRHAKVIVSSGEPEVSQSTGTEEKTETK
jgi:molecular chaperone GrpE